jgi:hypothetical protein
MAAITKTERASRGAGIAVTLCLVLGGCDGGDTTQKSNERVAATKRETALMADATSAGPILEQRLAEKVRVADGLLFANEHTFGLFVLPANAAWTIECGFGFSIILGNSVTGAGGDVENDVRVILTEGRIDQKNCNILSARIGKRLQSMLGRDTLFAR